MTLILFYYPTDSCYGLLTSTGLFAGWRTSIDEYDLTTLSHWENNFGMFFNTTPEAWVIAHAIYNHLGTFSSIPTRESHPELFL